ncbi:F-box only protein 9 [Bicyclus anynana]|uniref:F-box only protein 9 n=1 Tax=Bicyclus anynana TaxID=110368 RepID=A0A6J1NU26_BICAN|nr:F-box only protein 9 [Bicyclus anynana]
MASVSGTSGVAGQEQDDSSSSNHSECDPTEVLDDTQLNNEVQPAKDELTAFRQQWLQELDSVPFPYVGKAAVIQLTDEKVSSGTAGSVASGSVDSTGKVKKQKESSVCETTEELDNLHIDIENKNTEDKSPQEVSYKKRRRKFDPRTPDEEKAKEFYLRGLQMERGGKLYAAIPYYKRAMTLKPDIEVRITNSSAIRLLAENASNETSVLKVLTPKGGHVVKAKKPETEEKSSDSEDEDVVEGEELVSRLQRILIKKGRLFRPAKHTEGAHISWLPYEVVQLVLRWVVGAELDAGSLERAAAACRGLYVAAREPDLWRCMCVRTWGKKCGAPADSGYTSWRHMYIERARVKLNGCYISKTTYMRPGENTYQDPSYQAWQYVDYYRYLRFFPDGVVLLLTTPQPPAACVARLQRRELKGNLGVVSGHYRLKGDMVVIVAKKAGSDKPPAPAGSARHPQPAEQQPHVFQMELQVRPLHGSRHSKLSWRRYAVATRRDQWSDIELAPGRFPPLVFSAVRAYTAEASAPLLQAKV